MKGGTLEFDIVANNDGIKKALNETEKRIAGISKATVGGGKSIDAMFDATNENIRIQKQVIKELESEYAKLEKNIKKVGPGRGQYQLQQQANAVKAEIEAEKNALTQLEGAVKKNEAAHVSLRTQLRNCVQQLAEMEQTGQRGTDAYRELQEETGRLTDAMGDAQTQARILAHDNAGLQGVISAVSGVAGAFSAAQGVVGLFAGENENLQKIMVKVQSLMAITIGLQQVANTLNKDSYFRIVTLTKAKQMFSAATLTTGKALVRFGVSAGVARVAATALMATLTFGLSAAITGVVVLFERFRRKAAEAKKAQKDFNNAIVEASVKPIAAFKELQGAYNALGDDMEKKQRFIDTNKTKFQELGVSVTSVKEAEDLLVRNSSKFIESCVLRAKAIASQELAVEKYKEVLKAQQKLEATPKAHVSKKGTYTDGYGTQRKGTVHEKSSDWKKAEEAVKKVEREYDNLINQQVEFTTKEKEILASLNQSAATTTEGSIAAIEENIRLLKTKYKEATDDTTRDGFLAQIKEQETLLKKLDKSTTSGGSNNKDPFLSQLEERKKKYTEYYNWVNSKDDIVGKAAQTEFAGLLSEGSNYLDYLKKQREQLSQKIGDGSATKAQTEKLHKLNNAIAEETKDTVLAEFEKELQNQLNGTNSILEMLNVLEEKRKALQDDKSGLKQEKTEVVDKQESTISEDSAREAEAAQKELQKYYDSKINFEERYLVQRKALELKAENETDTARKAIYQNVISALDSAHTLKNVTDYDALAQEYRSYEQKRADIAADYDKKIALARANSNSELEATLIQQKEKEQLANSFEELKGSPEYIRAFEDLKNTSSETLNVLLAKMEEVKSSAAENLSPEDLRAYTDTMFTIVSELNERDPFTAVKKGYKELKAAERELAAAERELAAVRGRGAAGTAEESQAINKVNAAKDKYLKKNNQVKISERTAINSVKALSDEMSNLGSAVGGEAGEIISLIGDVGSFTMSAISGFGTASKASATAIKTVEKASVILAIIGAAIQLATKVASLFANDNAEYDKAKESYESYIKVLDEVIAKQKELVETMAGENAVNSYKYAISLIEKSAEAARELGKQRLNAGASAGSHSYGVRQRKKMDSNDWAAAASALGGAYDSSISSGRMTGLFDLTAEQLEKLKSEAPTFWAKLDSDAQEYLQAIIDSNASLEEMKDSLNESLTGVSFDSLSDDFLETLTDMDMNAKTFASQFSEYMRKALIQNMFKSQYQSQLEKWYQMWSDAMNPDSAGGSAITAEEQSALDTLKNSIINGAIAGAEAINQQFTTETEPTTTMSGAISSASQESIDLLAGQTNAVRVNQVESIEILRQQLIHLASIDSKVGTSNKYLEAIEKNTAANNSDPLRAQGITN